MDGIKKTFNVEYRTYQKRICINKRLVSLNFFVKAVNFFAFSATQMTLCLFANRI